jgi:hypothetical protein
LNGIDFLGTARQCLGPLSLVLLVLLLLLLLVLGYPILVFFLLSCLVLSPGRARRVFVWVPLCLLLSCL